ncbi:MAG: hypothetical protein EOP50_22265 [Sphingobacteriales bacterium]|nr:MAG: hypothetical protein EOP50_22265 [Sphingobacteriales bacterium]
MDYDFPKSSGYRSLMTGLFAGLCATLACLLFNLVFRTETHFRPTAIINIATLAFAVNLLFPVLGLIYNAFRKASRNGRLVYSIVFLLLTALCVWRAEAATRGANPLEVSEFRTLLVGVILILGVCAALLLPFLYHNRSFEEHVV